MIFYHYTTRSAIRSILEQGLTQGEAPLSHTRVARAINLTTDPDPSGHGLDMGGRIVTAEESALLASKGFIVPPGTVYANKREARIRIKIPSSDPKLKHWRSWSRKHCEPGYPDILEQSAGATPRKARTWWLYFGVVPPTCFEGIEILVPEASSSSEGTERKTAGIAFQFGPR
jgi:hypothetical protein